jgi:hypothetical protein
MTWNSAFIAPNQKNITKKIMITSKLFPNIMKVANCRNYIPKPGLSISTGTSKPYIFASPQELEKVIVPSCPGLPVPPSMFQCILDGYVKPD